MNKKVSFHELAEFELNDATVFFEIEREGLGLRFLSEVELLSLKFANVRKPHQ